MKAFDQKQMGAAFGFPGIDPRVWCAWGIVQFIKIDAAGPKADVAILPTGEIETVAIGGQHGRGHGLYIPIQVDQLVMIEFREGDADAGGVIVGSRWDTGDPPPDVVLDNPLDTALVGRIHRTMRLLAQGNGNLVAGADVGQVLLGDEAASLGAARVTDTVEVTIPPGTVVILNPLFPGPGQPEFIPNPLPITLSGSIVSGSAKVRVS